MRLLGLLDDTSAEVKRLRDDLSRKMGEFAAARQDLARLNPAALPADLAEEHEDLISTADWIVGPIQSAWSEITEAYDSLFGTGLGLAPLVIGAAVVAGGAALVLVSKFLVDYASFRERVALVKGGLTPAEVERLSASSPLFSLDSKLVWIAGLAVAGLAIWAWSKSRR